MAKCEHCGVDPDVFDKVFSKLMNQVLTTFCLLIVFLFIAYVFRIH